MCERVTFNRRRSNHPGNSQAPETQKVDNLESDDFIIHRRGKPILVNLSGSVTDGVVFNLQKLCHGVNYEKYSKVWKLHRETDNDYSSIIWKVLMAHAWLIENKF